MKSIPNGSRFKFQTNWLKISFGYEKTSIKTAKERFMIIKTFSFLFFDLVFIKYFIRL